MEDHVRRDSDIEEAAELLDGRKTDLASMRKKVEEAEEALINIMEKKKRKSYARKGGWIVNVKSKSRVSIKRTPPEEVI